MEPENCDSIGHSDISNQDDERLSSIAKDDVSMATVVTRMNYELAELKEKFQKIESTLGIEKVMLKDLGDKMAVQVDMYLGSAVVPVQPTPQPFSIGIQPAENLALRSPSAATVSIQQPMGTKGAPPGGMTAEQLQDFKKMTLQINAMQQKIKDLENKLTEAVTGIKKGNERADEMEEKGTETIKDIYKCIDQINNSMSEKIAQQKVEVQKITGDTPKPINYDPFNYGEAYGGDIVDFQARRRIIEIKILLQGLQASMNQLRDSVRISPSIDLGYKVIRLDQLIASSGFGKAIQKGEVNHEDALLVSNSKIREPGKIEFPKKEIFQVTDDMESGWAITDSIMQTMYRLEMELGELQKVVGSSDLGSNTKLIEDLQTAVKHIKDKTVDIKTVKRLIEESLANKHPQTSQFEKKNQIADVGSTVNLVTVSKAKYDHQIKNITTHMSLMEQRLAKMETFAQKRSKSAASKTLPTTGNKEPSCLSCDREIDVPNTTFEICLPNIGYFNPTLPRDPKIFQMPSRLRYVMTRTYDIEVGKHKTEMYSIPRPVGGGYSQYWPLTNPMRKIKAVQEPKVVFTDNVFIQGYDGRLYKADKTTVQKIPEVNISLG